MKATPIDSSIVSEKIQASGLKSIGRASIREIRSLINDIEQASGEKFIRMEMGIPGLPAAAIGIEAEKKALDGGCASFYPDIQGIPELKSEISRFVKLFLDLDVDASGCLPCTGSTSGSFVTFMVAGRMNPDKDTVLFLDPGFPVHKQQLNVLGIKHRSLDVYNYRGEKLREPLEAILKEGNISCILYSNPNNPTWICFTDTELRIIGELATKYDVIVMEDLAYFTMDFRKDYSIPGQPPFQPSVGKYTDNYILLISSSKAFSYAGQRVGMIAISNALFEREVPTLSRFFTQTKFGRAMVFGSAYAVSAGVTHSSQYGLAALLKATNDATYRFIDDVRVYGRRAHVMKQYFLDNGFYIVYDKDEDEPIADGFYFTVAYPGMDGIALIEELLYYGISAISLANTGSERLEGIRACVSLVPDERLPELKERLQVFHENHPPS
ncbi:MAG: pyridoxal phosphate-dependent aminotransferase [Bacteroidetes bacterium]|nr:pyridoxal phosphate-dependent aminotransferase [Bacteroidota bacterium]